MLDLSQDFLTYTNHSYVNQSNASLFEKLIIEDIL